MDVSSLAPRIREILQLSDLSTVSAKKVRRQLEHEMNITLDAYKTDIDEIIKSQFQQIHNETQQRQQVQQQYASQYAAQQGGHMGMYGLSPSVQGLQMPPGGGFHSAPMHHHAQISPNAMAPGMMHGGAGAQAGATEDQTPRKRGRPRKPENERKQARKKRPVDPNKPKRQTGLSKPMKLSADLRDFLDQKYCARLDVVKKLWEYIKQHNLQDPADKRYILCDEQMKKLFDCDRLYMYTMNKLLNEHLTKPTPEENAEAIALLGLPPNHPANADSAGLTGERRSVGGADASGGGGVGGAPESPAPSDGGTEAVSDAQQSVDNSGDDDDDDDGASQPVSPGSQPPVSPSLALPPQSAGSNATN